jgi:hypothetical protein
LDYYDAVFAYINKLFDPAKAERFVPYQLAWVKMRYSLADLVIIIVTFVFFSLFSNLPAKFKKKLRGYCSQHLASHGSVSGVADMQAGFGTGYTDKK